MCVCVCDKGKRVNLFLIYSDDFGPARIPAGYRRTPSPVVTRFDRANSPPPPTPHHHGNNTHADTYEMQIRPAPDTRTMDGFLQEVKRIILMPQK